MTLMVCPTALPTFLRPDHKAAGGVFVDFRTANILKHTSELLKIDRLQQAETKYR